MTFDGSSVSETSPLLPNATTSVPVCSQGGRCCAVIATSSSESKLPTCCSTASPSLGQPGNDDDYCHLADQPWKYKAVALTCALLLAVGSHFAAHTLGAMKPIIKQHFGISNSQYGVLQSTVSIVNTVLPFANGILIDAFGTIPGSIFTTLLITSGNVLVALSTHSSSLSMMILGRVLYGIGSGAVVIVQETILSQWFKGRHLASVVALMLTVSRLSSFLAQATVVFIAKWTGWYGYAFWFSALLCVFSLVVNLVYIALLRKVSTNSYACQAQINVIKRKKSFQWSKLMYLPHSFWLIVAMEFLLGGGWGCFLHINSEFVKVRFGYDDAHAAATASVAQLLPVFLMPVLGVCLDRYGKRTWMMIISGVSFLLSMILLGYTSLSPIIGMLCFSASLSLGPVGLVSSVPVILPLSLVGTSMGLIKSGTNIGASLFDMATGFIQDADRHKGYSGIIVFFIVIGALSVICGIILCVLDYTVYDRILDRNARQARLADEQKINHPMGTMREKLKINYLYAGIYVALAVLSWILFVRFVFLS
ncbi:major facilitator superfamily domain-containing protein [Radiomyces spectabilis]|uniref:major facilitator superfamily domain-containing protein n=1 Tax=Radiomyces spectabilis TaxID=64574 RepID=UPI00221F0F0D|nr:major facilitator superfamily domain-containing protein [Radiomyces spectabilis]KAI8372748.1 major facilitator superfamily domain-containing protein [Radiomyces spectabilis]